MPRVPVRPSVSAAFRKTAAALLALPWLAGQAAVVEIRATTSDGKPLPDAVVFLESAAARAAVKPLPGTEVEQADRKFTRRVTVVPVGSEVAFPNRDKVRHHVYSFSPTKTFELKLYSGTPANPVLFDKAGIAVLGCNIHDNMVAWVVVVETPYYGVAAAPGTVKLDNVPAGTYKLCTWHPALPPGAPAGEQTLVVPAAGVSLAVPLPLTAAAL